MYRVTVAVLSMKQLTCHEARKNDKKYLFASWQVCRYIDSTATVTLYIMQRRALKLDVASCYQGNMKTNISGKEAAPRFAVYWW